MLPEPPTEMVGGSGACGYSGDMFALFQIQNALLAVVTLAVFVFQAWAFIDAASRRPDAFAATDKLTKPTWLIILGIALAAHMLIWNPFSFLNIAGIVAALVYLVDVRPAIRSLPRQ